MDETYNLITVDEGKAALGIVDMTNDDTLAIYITAISRRLDDACGPIVQRTITNELLDGGRQVVRTTKHPVSSITSVTEYDDTASTTLTRETNASQPDDGYYAEPHPTDQSLFNGYLRRRSAGSNDCFPAGYGNVVVTYVAGRYASTAVVDANFKQAATIMLRNLWRSEQQSVQSFGDYDVPVQSFPTFAVPNAVRELLRDEWQEVPGFA